MQWVVVYLVRYASGPAWVEVRRDVEAPTACAARRAFREGLRLCAKRVRVGRHVETRLASAPVQGELFAPK